MTDGEPRFWPGHWSRLTPDKPAFAMGGEVVTHAELDRRSNQMAQLFRARGLRAGDTLALLAENSPRYLEICWGAQRSGLRYVPINWHLVPGEIEYILSDCGATALVASARFGDLLREVMPRLPRIQMRLSLGGPIPGFEPVEALAEAQPATPIEPEIAGSNMIYTSGSTGRPKGGRRPTPNAHPGAPSIDSRFLGSFGLNEHSVYLSPGAPLYHAAPLRFCMGVIGLGGSCVILERFEPLAALEAIEKWRVTQSQWVPTMFVRLLRLSEADRNRFDLSSHEMALHAAAPCAIPIKQAMLDWWGPILHEYYGGSEGGGSTYITPEEWLAHPGSVGRALGKTRIHIIDANGEDMPPGTAGVIYFEGGVPIQYHNDPEKTKRAHHPKGWVTLGDIGYLDDDDYLYLTDRKDFVIIVGGVNIYPQETENVLITHPKVVDVAVFGVPNAEYGEEVKAVVQLADPSVAGAALEAELLEFCRANLSKQKCPRSIDFDPELPRSPAGKIYKHRLRDRYWAGRSTRTA